MNNEQKSIMLKWFEAQIQFIKSLMPFEEISNNKSQQYRDFSLFQLNNIDPSYFDLPKTIKIEQLFIKLQKYLEKQMGKKFKKIYKHKLQKRIHEQVQEDKFFADVFLPLALYIFINSKQKSQFINRILELPESIQNELKTKIQDYQKNILENIIETKQILEQITIFSEENDELQSKLSELQSKNQDLVQFQKEMLEQNYHLWELTHKDQMQKLQIVHHLRINDVQEYSQMLKNLENKKQRFLLLIQQLEKKSQNSDQEINDLNQRISTDQIIIQELHLQILKYREKYIQSETNKLQMQSAKPKNQPILNNILEGLNEKRMNNSDRQPLADLDKSSELLAKSQRQDEGSKLLQYNGELMGKCMAMQQKIRKIKEQMEVLNERNLELEKENNDDHNKIKSIFREQMKFEKQYRTANKLQQDKYRQKMACFNKYSSKNKKIDSKKKI